MAPTTQTKTESAGASERKHRNTRRRQPKTLPSPPQSGEVVWAKKRPELDGYGPAQAAHDLFSTSVFEEVVVAACEAIDRRHRRANKAIYSSAEMEQLTFLQYAYGCKSVEGKGGLIQLLRHPDRRADLELLGFGQPRDIPDGLIAMRKDTLDGLPRGARFSDHNKRVSWEVRRDWWCQIYETLRAEELALLPQEELLVTYLDSSHLGTIYTCPIFDAVTGEIVNHDDVTCWDGGRLPKDSHDPHAEGFKATMLWTCRGTPLGFTLGRITEHDTRLGLPLIHSVGPLLKARIDTAGPVGVTVCDSGFHTRYDLRAAIRSYGLVESCAETSAVNEARGKEEDARWIPFRNRPQWGTNGHREPNCECGTARITRVFPRAKDGSVTPRINLECPKHGNFTITSGQYLLAEKTCEWVKYDPIHTLKDATPEILTADLRLGNALTFNDWLHIAYVTKRWGHNEGVHGALSSAQLLFDGKNRFRSRAQAETAMYMVFSYLHLRGITYRTRRASQLDLAA